MYVFGNYINENLTIKQGLYKIRGVGFRKIEEICSKFGLSENQLLSKLSDETMRQIVQYISDELLYESELRKQSRIFLSQLVKIRSYRGLRHRSGLPARGQRTHSNAKTVRRQKKG